MIELQLAVHTVSNKRQRSDKIAYFVLYTPPNKGEHKLHAH